jgi:predicted ArsR family transcriptional regulator
MESAVPGLRGVRGQIVRRLRGAELTVDDLAARLELTPNGVRFHLADLERDGLVAQRSVRRGPRKPSHGYSLTAAGEALFPRAYDAVLNGVLREVRGDRGGDALRSMFDRLGRDLAERHAHRFPGLDQEARVGEAVRVLGELGGAATVERAEAGATVVAGRSCPFAAVVPEHPEVCALLEGFLECALPGCDVAERCDKVGTPHCRFEVSPRT